MTAPDFFETIGSRGFYRPVAQVTFEQAIEMVAAAMRYAREHGLVDLLANTNDLTGFSQPSTFARYSLAVKWAEAAGGALRVALVTRAEIIDPQKIGVLMAQNRGVNGDVFTNETDALAWLDARI
jgi:isopropylmalate/homocitrate/citramalate synthase